MLNLNGIFSTEEKMILGKGLFYLSRRGAALIISMVFVLVFSALGVALFSMSSGNVQMANNQQKAERAFASAESGVQVMRYWLSQVLIPSSTAPSDYLSTIVGTLQSELTANYISNITVNSDGSIAPVTLDSGTGQTFEGQIQMSATDPYTLEAFATGNCGGIARTIRINYNIQPYEHPIFNFGLATKGPLDFPGNPTFAAVNSNWEADIYIESLTNPLALCVIGNTNFDGDINVGNPDSDPQNFFLGDVQIAGDTGQAAIDNHVDIGADSVDFPLPDTDHFRPYATGDIIDSQTVLTGGMTIINGVIEGGTNPYFDGSVTIQGVLFIEPPNQVTFGRNVNLQGIIVAGGSAEDATHNTISFLGNFDTDPFPPDPQFDVMRHETGASIIAPGFGATFAGNFSALDGVMAVDGVHFAGNANAVIKGTIINYSDTPAVVEGNATLTFDRLETTKIPAGFDTHRELNYDPGSYSMIQSSCYLSP
jgi:Tfp pilus assembly protein PilX